MGWRRFVVFWKSAPNSPMPTRRRKRRIKPKPVPLSSRFNPKGHQPVFRPFLPRSRSITTPIITMPRERVGLSQRLGGGGNQSGSSGDPTFSPSTTVVVFNHRDFFFKHHDHFFHHGNGRFFSRDGSGKGSFFGTSATTNRSVAGPRPGNIQSPSVMRDTRKSRGGSVGLRDAPRMSGRFVTRQRNTIVQRNFTVGPSMGARSTLSSRREMAIGSGQQFSATPQVGSMGRSFGMVHGSAMSGPMIPSSSAGGAHHWGSFGGHGGGGSFGGHGGGGSFGGHGGGHR